MKTKQSIHQLLIVTLLFFMYACDENTGNEEVTLESSWQLFENGDYENARNGFQSLIADQPEAAVGLGWSLFRLNSIQTAVTQFETQTDIDANAGAIFAYWILKNYQKTIEKAQLVIAANNSYVFSRQTSVNHQDVKLHLAYSQYHLGQYGNCIATIKLLDANFGATENDTNISVNLLTKLEELKTQVD